jgi:hypothetical protein
MDMKRITTLFAILMLVAFESWAVAIHAVQSDRVIFHNFSAGTYDMTGHILTVGTTQYNVNVLNVISGALATTAGMYTELELPANAPSAAGSVALWASGTNFPNPISALMVSYVAWGAGGQAYEAEAVAAGKWQVNAYVNFTLPIKRSLDYAGNGPSYWYSSMGKEEISILNFLEVYPSPFHDELNLRFEQGHDYSDVLLYNVLGQLIYQKRIMQETVALNLTTSELKQGIYLLEVRTNKGKSQVKKMVKR